MLKKLPEIEVQPSNPFANDKLARNIPCQNLTNLVKSLTQPFVLAVTSPWGTGKTTFIKMWQAMLQNEGLITIYYNAWENDFSKDAFVSFVGEIEEYIQKGIIVPNKKKSSTTYLKRMKEAGSKITLKLTPLAIKLATRGTLSSIEEIKALLTNGSEDEVADLLSNLAEAKISEYQENKKSIRAFKEHLQKFIESVAKTDHTFPMVFFIDELDRCRPDYAIELLERIKHLFSVRGLVFVLAIDKSQLVESVRSIYGLNMAPDGYLRKFIDLEYQLPIPSTPKFCDYLIDSFEINDILLKRRSHVDRDYLRGFFAHLADIFCVSLRVQAQCFMQINLALRTTYLNELLDICYLTFLVLWKARAPDLYEAFNQRRASDKQLLTTLSETYDFDKVAEYDQYLKAEIAATIERAYKNSKEYEELIKKYHQKASSQKMDNSKQQIDEHMAEYISRELGYDIHKKMVEKLEIIEQFNTIDI